jgi:hypothetical protein
MNINLIYEFGYTNYGYKAVFEEYSQYCLNNIPDINFNIIDSNNLKPSMYNGNNEKYGPHYMMIENPNTKKYILISYWDKLTDVVYHHKATNFDIENCIDIITSAGCVEDITYFNPIDYNYTPFSYTCTIRNNEKIIEEIYKNIENRVYPEMLSFRGFLYQFREYLSYDSRFNISDSRTPNGFLSPEEYIKDIGKYHINLSLNGAGEICNRDIEILGLGSALLRLKLSTKFHNTLIPDYHYISVDHDDIESTDLDDYYKQLSDRIFQRYEQVKNDKDFIQFIANNGRKWYEENGTISANVKLLNKLINFNKLL